MTKGLSNVQNTYLAGDSLLPVTLVKIGLAAGDVLYTDCPYDITYNGDTYEAQGDFLGVSESQEKSELQITTINLVISALDIDNVRDFAFSGVVNKEVEIRKAFVDPITGDIIGDSAGDQAIIIFKGKISGYSTTNDDAQATIQLEIASQFINFDRKNGRRTNLSNFQIEHPTDFGMEYSHETVKDVRWGKK